MYYQPNPSKYPKCGLIYHPRKKFKPYWWRSLNQCVLGSFYRKPPIFHYSPTTSSSKPVIPTRYVIHSLKNLYESVLQFIIIVIYIWDIIYTIVIDHTAQSRVVTVAWRLVNRRRCINIGCDNWVFNGRDCNDGFGACELGWTNRCSSPDRSTNTALSKSSRHSI